MNEFEIHQHTNEQILNRVKNIDWYRFYIGQGSKKILKADFENIIKLNKFKNLKNLQKEGHALLSKEEDAAITVKIPFYFYDPVCILLTDNGELKIKAQMLEQEIKGVFYVTQRLKDLKLIFDAVDNQNVDKNIEDSKSLRALKFKMIESFYDDACKLFLTLIMDFIYDCSKLDLNGEDIQDESLKIARYILNLMDGFDADLKAKIGGDAIYDKIETEHIPDPTKKTTKEKKPRKKKTKAIVENK